MTGPLETTGEQAGVARRRRILVVEDEPTVRDALALVLRDASAYEVETARDGAEADAKLQEFRPDLLLLDLVMPDGQGLEVCRRARDLYGPDEVKIIILTGYPEGGNREKSLFFGADLFLPKPQTVPDLLAHIEELLDT